MKTFFQNILITLYSIIIFTSCNNPFPLEGKWKMVEWEGNEMPKTYDIIYNFSLNGEYTDSRSEGAIWNYEYYPSDSIVLYHHGFYGDRYKILKKL